jgi:Na+/melibiose symporter-like transporter
MGPTRKRDLTAAAVGVAVIACLLMIVVYLQSWFPRITLWTGISLLGVAVAEALWARYVRAKINDGEIGDGGGRLHPIAVARTVTIAKASAWVGALVLGWWLGVLAYLLPHRSLPVAVNDTPGAAVAAGSALALIVAALWLQHCCEKPEEPPDNGAATSD